MPCDLRRAWLLLVLAIAGSSALAWADERALPVTRTRQIESLSAEEKQELLRNKERFDKLPADQQRQLRELHASLSAAPDGERLAAVMARYHDWLMQSLSAAQRAELLSLPEEQRLERIKQLMQEQQAQRLRNLAEKLPPEDAQAIIRWLEEFVERHEEPIMRTLPQDMQRMWGRVPDVSKRRRMLLFALHYRRPGQDIPLPAKQDFERLLPSLSAAAQEQLQQTKDAGQRELLIKEWVRAALMSTLIPPVSDEDLRNFYKNLPVKDRESLESLPPEQMRQQLVRMYQAQHFRQGMGRGMFFPPFPPPDGGQGPRRPGEGRPFEGRPGEPRPGPFSRPGGPGSPAGPGASPGPGSGKPQN